jgi:hypothetical protein
MSKEPDRVGAGTHPGGTTRHAIVHDEPEVVASGGATAGIVGSLHGIFLIIFLDVAYSVQFIEKGCFVVQ